MMVGIQADDLTGACDTGAPFAARGLETLVVVTTGTARRRCRTRARPSSSSTPRVESGRPTRRARVRAWPAARSGPGRAASSTRSSIPRSAAASPPRSTECSTARGWPWRSWRPRSPPRSGCVVDGQVRVDGRLADETPMARDPTFPPTGSSVLGLLAAGGVRPMTAVPLATVRRGRDAIAARLLSFSETGGRVLVADAETDADLSVLAEAAHDRVALLAGSAGLATALAGLATTASGRDYGWHVPACRWSWWPAVRTPPPGLSCHVWAPRGPRRPGSSRGRGRSRSRPAPRDGHAARGRRARADRARAAGGAPPDRRRDGDRGAARPSAPAGSA